MVTAKKLRFVLSLLAACMLALPILAQDDRGKAELNAPGGKILADYGRPQLKGRDPLTWQKVGDYWRMGKNEMTTTSTTFGSSPYPNQITKIGAMASFGTVWRKTMSG